MSMEKPLFKNASFAFETSAMTFDEVENKLYWVKNGETIFSSTADGEEVTRHVTIEGAQITCLVSKAKVRLQIQSSKFRQKLRQKYLQKLQKSN